MRRSRLLLVVGLTYTAIASTSIASEAIYRELLRSSVFIENPAGSLGSGVVIDAERRLIATNFHVVEEATHIVVYFPKFEGDQIVAERSYYVRHRQELGVQGVVRMRDRTRDLAIVQVERISPNATEIAVAKEGAVPGQVIHSIGNPGESDACWVYTKGAVRQVYRRQMSFSDGMVVDALVVETQSPVNPGDSGGPVVNDQGELVAIVQSLSRSGQVYSICIDVRELLGLRDSGPSQELHTPLPNLLDSARLSFQHGEAGEVFVSVPVFESQVHPVMLISEPESYNGVRAWRGLCFMCEFPHIPSQVVRAWVERANRTIGMNAFRLRRHSDGTTALFFEFDIPTDIPGEQLRNTLVSIAERALLAGKEIAEQEGGRHFIRPRE